jgi:hypothetical protein
MSGAKLLGLFNELELFLFQGFFNQMAFVAGYQNRLFAADFIYGINDIFNHRFAENRVNNLGESRFHAGPLPGCQNQSVKSCCHIKPQNNNFAAHYTQIAAG